ncbi:MAG: aminopeptidase P N-terminal domain-containing protein [Chitinophagales bacterium]|nr:aminopeptidase P N-terminal domain-containing protein [Chitinophagales bacterium]
MKYPPLPKKVFIENRKKFSQQLLPNSIAIFLSNDEMPKSGDSTFPFRQNADLFYLSGIDQEDTMLLLYPDCALEEYRETLLLRRTNEVIAVWEGHKYTIEEAREQSGIQQVMWIDELETILHMLMVYADHVYLDSNENYRAHPQVNDKNLRFTHQLMDRFPLHQYHRSAQILLPLRQIKSETEINLIKEAIRITAAAFDRVLKFVRPGVTEYEIEAEITHEFLRNRSTGHAFSPIIASGKNTCVLHYVDNNQTCNDGDLLLLDYGADYANYAADLTRTIPVNGKFNVRQKDVYNAVLRVQQEATKMLRPGTIIHQYHDEVGKIMEKELIGLGLLKKEEVEQQDKMKPLYKKYFMHGTSHHLGLDVHDFGSRFHALQPGMVFTCEPGIYIPEEKIGIRLENDVLVTEGDPIDLMSMIPVGAEEIEALMQKR